MSTNKTIVIMHLAIMIVVFAIVKIFYSDLLRYVCGGEEIALKRGKTYYVEVTRCAEPYMEDNEDYEELFCDWHGNRALI